MCLTASVWWNIHFSPRLLNVNSIIVDLLQQRKVEVHMLFRFEAVDPGTKTAGELGTYASAGSSPEKKSRLVMFDHRTKRGLLGACLQK